MGKQSYESDNSKTLEQVIYWVIWILIALIPLFSEYRIVRSGGVFQWRMVLEWWRGLLPFVVAFSVHNYILIPKLLFGGHGKWYPAALLALTLIFMVHEYHFIENRKKEWAEFSKLPSTENPDYRRQPPPPHYLMRPPLNDGHKPPHPPKHHVLSFKGPFFFPLLLILLMYGLNLSIALMVKHLRDREHVRSLENMRLQDELKYLRSQINPHFFMNMLNNIHTMVDIDPAKAQYMILELSKILRSVLYESDLQKISLAEEISFITSYISLMRQRYPENKVDISLSVPDPIPDKIELPPLLLIAFIENAFKHGISYMKRSKVDISLSEAEGNIIFSCVNTKPNIPGKSRSSGGVGLENVRRRLSLLYGDKHSLIIQDKKDKYNVTLIIPCQQ